MSNEFVAATDPDLTIYVILKNSDGKFWNGSSFETYATANRGNYDIAMVEQGTSSGIYLGDFPSLINTSGTYTYYAYIQDGGSPAEPPTDTLVNTGSVDWTGTASANGGLGGAGSMTGSDWAEYVRRGGWKRTDKDTELFEATSDAIQELRSRFKFDEAHADTDTTDTISTLGDFKISIDAAFGMLTDVILEDDTNATNLIHVSKAQFDELYPDINVTNDRGYPKYFTLYQGQIQIGPVPDSVDYLYRMVYSKSAGLVTSATTAIPFTALYREMLRHFTLERLYELVDSYDKAQYFRSKGELMFEQARSKESLNQGKSFFMVKPFSL